MKSEQEYPSNWILGKPKGTIQDWKYPPTKEIQAKIVVYKDENNNEKRQRFYFKDYNNDVNETEKQAQIFLKNHSDNLNATKNMLRYLDEDTIEVDLGKNNYIKTDAKFIDIIEKYYMRFDDGAVLCQCGDTPIQFYKLITNYKKIKFLNSDKKDYRLCNLKESYAISSEKELDALYSYQCSINPNYNDYKKDIWILGKPSGCFITKKGEVTVRIKHNGKEYDRTLSCKKYGSEENVLKEAEKIRHIMSYEAKLTNNMIRKINDSTIQVKLNNVEKIATVDIFMLPLIQTFLWSENTDLKTDNFCTYKDKSYKKYETLMNLPIMFRRDGNQLNNCLDNLYFDKILSESDSKLLCTKKEGKTTMEINLLKIKRTYVESSYNYNQACEYTKFLLNLIDHKSIIEHSNNNIVNNDDLIKCKKYLEGKIDKIYDIVNFDYNKFIPDIDDSIGKKRMFYAFISHFLGRIKYYNEKINMIIALLNKNEYKFTVININKFDVYIPTIDTFKSDIDEIRKNKIVKKSFITMDCDNLVDDISRQNKKESYQEYTKRKCIQKYKDIVLKKGGHPLFKDEDYISAHGKLKIKCQDNHEFEITGSNLNLGKWCPECNCHQSELLTVKLMEHMFKKEFKKVRPDWLKNIDGNNLELDGYNEELKLAVEYNGVQHYKFIPHFHRDENALEKIQNHDAIKLKLCQENNVNLIVVPYTIPQDEIAQYLFDETTKLGYKPGTYDDFDIEIVNKLASQHEKTLQKIKEKDGILLKGVYMYADSELTVRCKNNHEFTTTPKNLNRDLWCDDCAHIMTDSKRKNISIGMKKFHETDEAKEKKQESHAKRSETMAKQKVETRKNVTEKQCGYCKQRLSISEFNIKTAAKDGYQTNCKKCVNEIKKGIRAKGLLD
ncbi:MAG: hypothetical protein Terrestrivirus3_148 [Terrestrivirus sp.]|uniref:Uncharacterized protein n=1 Tax=Terrestrivirus sp. TaxID=2487775 RepID=A0A3G4ZR27_9VIRU|nr:MAG: hypothetical protein Terrestrivirus3_148 [Terrestrivirus sp.]